MLSKTTSREVMERDSWRCRSCKWTDGLHVHHVIFKSHMGTDNPNNLVTLCWQCHRAVHEHKLLLDKVGENEYKFTRKGNWKPS